MIVYAIVCYVLCLDLRAVLTPMLSPRVSPKISTETASHHRLSVWVLRFAMMMMMSTRVERACASAWTNTQFLMRMEGFGGPYRAVNTKNHLIFSAQISPAKHPPHTSPNHSTMSRRGDALCRITFRVKHKKTTHTRRAWNINMYLCINDHYQRRIYSCMYYNNPLAELQNQKPVKLVSISGNIYMYI